MTTHTTGAQRLAICTGVVATGGALAILLAEPISTWNWQLTHFIIPVIVTITIAVGHLAHSALKDRKLLSALGFAVVFVIGTGLTVYSSVGSQAEKSGNKAANAEAHNEAIRTKRDALEAAKKKLAANDAMLATQQTSVTNECKSGEGKLCKGAKASLEVYKSAVRGDRSDIRDIEKDLASLGGELAARPKAEAFATAAAVFGYDKKKIETAATVLEPFAYSLLLELTAIIAFGYGFAQRKQVVVQAPAPVKAITEEPTCPPDAELEELKRILGILNDWVSNKDLAKKAGVSPSEMSKWTRKGVEAGFVHKVKQGKHMMIKLAEVAPASVAIN